jgi:hypothetical protein
LPERFNVVLSVHTFQPFWISTFQNS